MARSSPHRLGSPAGRGLRQGRTDMGVDFSGRGYVLAVLDGVVTYVGRETGSGSAGGNGPFVIYKTKAGYVYVAEQWTPLVKVGDRVKQGERIGSVTGGHIEVGWAAGSTGNWNTAAKAGGGYTDGQVTAEGRSFAEAIAGGDVPAALPTPVPAEPQTPNQTQAQTQAQASPPQAVAENVPQTMPPGGPPDPYGSVPEIIPPGAVPASGLAPAQVWQTVSRLPMASPESLSFAQQLAQATGGGN